MRLWRSIVFKVGDPHLPRRQQVIESTLLPGLLAMVGVFRPLEVFPHSNLQKNWGRCCLVTKYYSASIEMDLVDVSGPTPNPPQPIRDSQVMLVVLSAGDSVRMTRFATTPQIKTDQC